MKKIIFVFLLFIVNCSLLIAQTGWYWANPLPQGNRLAKVKFIDNNTGFILGQHGTLLRTLDGGLNWYSTQLTTLRIYSIFFVNSQTGYISASKGTLFKSTNSGNNWLPIVCNNFSGSDFNDIYFMNENTGFAVWSNEITSGYVYKTTNGGLNWNTLFTVAGGLTRIYFKDINTGFATGYNNVIIRTTNGGTNWSILNIAPGTYSQYGDIAFADDMRGYIISYNYGDIVSTTDGGITWPIVNNYSNDYFFGISFANQNTGSICGSTYQGSILHTTNGGINWAVQSSLYTRLYGIYHISPSTMFAIADGGRMYRTSNEGAYWDTITKGYTGNLNRIIFVDSLTGWAVGGSILKTTNGGDNWIRQPGGYSASDIFFANNNTGFGIYGSASFYLTKTSNGGINWTVSSFPIYGYYNGISGVSSDTLFVAGRDITYNNGQVYISVNGGNSWSLTSYTGSPLYDVKFINSTTGFVCGQNGSLWFTTNTGTDWMSIYTGVTNHLNRIKFINSSTGWICGASGTILKTTNGGLNWIIQLSNLNNYQFYGINFINQNTGMVVGICGNNFDSSLTFITTNGGTNWIYNHTITSSMLYDVAYANSNKVVAVGTSGTIICSNTMGYSLPYPPTLISPYNNQNYVSLKPNLDWSDVPLIDSYTVQISTSASFDTLILNSTIPPISNLQLSSCVLFRNRTYFWRVCATNFVGTGNWSQVFSFSSTQSYYGWNLQDCPDTLSNNSVFMIDSLTGWIAGNNGKILKTISGGDCWFMQTSNSGRNLNSLYFISSSAGWAVGDSGTVSRTINGGNTWTNLSLSVTDKLNSVYFTSLDSGWITGNNGKLYKTTNSGQNWNQITIETSFNLNSIKFVNQSTGWICGDGGTVYKTTNSGLNWFLLTTNTSNNLSSIAFVNDSTVWTVGQNGLILKSNNGGNNWFTQNSHVTVNLNSIFFSSPDRGWIAADSGKLIATKTAGSDWKVQNTFSQKRIRSVSFSDINIGWICGSGGIIYYTKSGSNIVFVKNNTDEIPEKYSLSQNYPNPFNPVTKIKFDIKKEYRSQESEVKLSIYDILGRKIEDLVNEKLQPGSYEVTFDGSNLPSGVYFYQLRTGDYVETKKMLLIK
jgi:photosystem II stability/assembly factor-like uncharacterized protein